MVWTSQKQKILRKGGKNTQKNCTKKDLHDPDNHDGVITHTHLEPDILECEVKWALGSITRNKANGVMEFQLNYFKSEKMMVLKCCTQYASKFGKLSHGYRNGKGRFSFQSQRKAMKKVLKLLNNCTHLTHEQSNAQNSPSQARKVREL